MHSEEDLPAAEWLPTWWYVLLGALLVSGIALAIANPRLPCWLSVFSGEVMPDRWGRFAGIFVASIPITDFLTFVTVRVMDGLFGLRGESTIRDLWPATLVGVTEGVMYPLSIMAGFPEFIGVWLAVKLAGQWVRWGTKVPNENPERPRLRIHQIIEAKRGRRRFNKFLIRNALRILLGGLTYLIVAALTFERGTRWAV